VSSSAFSGNFEAGEVDGGEKESEDAMVDYRHP